MAVSQQAQSNPEHPRTSLAVELGYGCNQACAYCYNPYRASKSDDEAPAPELLLAQVSRLLSAWTVSQVTVTGGEPLLHPSLFPLLHYLKEQGVPRQLISNGTLVTKELAGQLAMCGVASVQVTLNGPTPALHRIHVGRDSYADVLRGVSILLETGLNVTGCVVLTRKNAHQVGELCRLWQELGVRTIALSRFSPAGLSLARVSEFLPRRQDLQTAFSEAQPFAKDGVAIHCTVPIPACLMDVRDFSPICFGQCAIGSPGQELALGPDGRLRLCTLHQGRLGQGRDVLDPDWDVACVPTSPEVVGYRTELPAFCAGCGAAASCLGGCGATSSTGGHSARRALDPLVQRYFGDESPASTPKIRLEIVHENTP